MKVAVGTDDFCPVCREWREFDDDGKCRVCGTSIRKSSTPSHKTGDEFDLGDFSEDSGEE